ncbi:MAG: VanW family protein [Limnochordia bacterium]
MQKQFLPFLIAIFLLSIIGGSLLGVYLAYNWPQPRVAPGYVLASLGIHIGGLTEGELIDLLEDHTQAILRPITLHLDGESWSVDPRDFGVSIDGTQTWRMLARDLRLPVSKRFLQLQLAYDEEALDAWLEDFAAQLERPPEDARWGPQGEVIPGKRGYRVAKERLKERLLAAWRGTTFTAVEVPLEVWEPTVGEEELLANPPAVEIAAFATPLDPSQRDRVHNIALAAKAIDGLVLEPGGEFSFNNIIGPREIEYGFRPAPELVQSRLVIGIGGGICQLSSTLYNAVLMAGLEVTERYNHSRPLSYVPLARDATVVYDRLDFRFRNTLSQPVRLRAFVDGSWLHVTIEGRALPARRARLREEMMAEILPAQEVPGSLPGYRARLWRSWYENGVLVEEELIGEDVYPPVVPTLAGKSTTEGDSLTDP